MLLLSSLAGRWSTLVVACLVGSPLPSFWWVIVFTCLVVFLSSPTGIWWGPRDYLSGGVAVEVVEAGDGAGLPGVVLVTTLHAVCTICIGGTMGIFA